MIGGICRGKAKNVIDYLFRSKSDRTQSRGQILGGTMLASDKEDLLRQCEYLARLRPDISPEVYHGFFSAAPGEHLSDLQMLRIGQIFAEELGIENFIVIRHDDGAMDHGHLLGTRVTSDGRVVREHLREFRKVERAMRRAEREFSLQRVPNPPRPRNKHGRLPQPTRITDAERDMQRRGQESIKTQLRNLIDDAIRQGYRHNAVLVLLQRQGFTPDVTRFRNGRPVSISFVHQATGKRFPAYKLGRDYSTREFMSRIGGLTHGLTNFRPERIKPYDAKAAWRRICRSLDQERQQRSTWDVLRSLFVRSRSFSTSSASAHGCWSAARTRSTVGRAVSRPGGRAPHQ